MIMDEIKNWRGWIICSLFCISVILLGADAEKMSVFIWTKVIGAALMVFLYMLYKKWENQMIEEDDYE